ncbi:MAG: SCP2 sterol-binding domain-containing protein [Hyphomicrobiaceae bacterium]|nr:SCP2 sterol-binding domain-containing protein [Hyphomicrobiaceae bacterium]
MISTAQRHPDLFDRLGPHAERTIAIAPTDVPVVFLLRPSRDAPGVDVRPDGPMPACDAMITGPVFALVDLAEGRLDGDALFFSRDIRIEGDVEAVLALRNALDGEGLDLVAEVMAPLGALAGGPERAGRRCIELLRTVIQATAPREAAR